MKEKNKNLFFFEGRFLKRVEDEDERRPETAEEMAVHEYLDGNFGSAREALENLNEEAEGREAKIESIYNIRAESLQQLSGTRTKSVIDRALQDLADANRHATVRIGKFKFWRGLSKLTPFMKSKWREQMSIDEYSQLCDGIEELQRRIQVLEARKEKREARINESISNLQKAKAELANEDSWFWQRWRTARRFKKSISRLEDLKDTRDASIEEARSEKKALEETKIEKEGRIRESTDKLYEKFRTDFVAPLQEMRMTRDSLKVDLARVDADLNGEVDDQEREHLLEIRREMIAMVNDYDKRIRKKETAMENWLNRDNVFQRNTVLALRGFMEKEDNTYAAVNWKERYRGHEEIKHRQGLIGDIMKGMDILNYQRAGDIYESIIKSNNVPAGWMEVFKTPEYAKVLQFLIRGNVDGRKIVSDRSKLMSSEPQEIVRFLESPFLLQALNSIGDEGRFSRKRTEYLRTDEFSRYGLRGFMEYLTRGPSLNNAIKARIQRSLLQSGFAPRTVKSYMRECDLNDLKYVHWNILDKQDCAIGMNVLVRGDRSVSYDGKSPAWIGRDNPDAMADVLRISRISEALAEISKRRRLQELWQEFVESGHWSSDSGLGDFLQFVIDNKLAEEVDVVGFDGEDIEVELGPMLTPEVEVPLGEPLVLPEEEWDVGDPLTSDEEADEGVEDEDGRNIGYLRRLMDKEKSSINFLGIGKAQEKGRAWAAKRLYNKIKKYNSKHDDLGLYWDRLAGDEMKYFYEGKLVWTEQFEFNKGDETIGQLIELMAWRNHEVLDKLRDMNGEEEKHLTEYLRFRSRTRFGLRKVPVKHLMEEFRLFFEESPDAKEKRLRATKLNGVAMNLGIGLDVRGSELDFYNEVVRLAGESGDTLDWSKLFDESRDLFEGYSEVSLRAADVVDLLKS